MPEKPSPEVAWKDARDLEYLRLDQILKYRSNLAMRKTLDQVKQTPDILSALGAVDNEIWNFLRPLFTEDAPVTAEADKEIAQFQRDANLLAANLGRQKDQGNYGLKQYDNRIAALFESEDKIYKTLMVMRHEKKLDIGLKREWTDADNKRVAETYVKGGRK